MFLDDEAPICPLCNGSGSIAYGPWGARPPKKTCPVCNGTRTILLDDIAQNIREEYRL